MKQVPEEEKCTQPKIRNKTQISTNSIMWNTTIPNECRALIWPLLQKLQVKTSLHTVAKNTCTLGL
jgi:hypothetical protein